MKMIVESMMECRLAGETEVLGENLPQRHFCPTIPVTSSLICPSIFLNTPFSNIPSLFSFLNVRDQVSRLYKIAGILIFYSVVQSLHFRIADDKTKIQN
jgi:hypothetical protein